MDSINNELKISIREPEETDIPFFFTTWLHGLYYGNSWFNAIDKDVFYEKYHEVLKLLLGRSSLRVACMEDEPDVILGYSVFTDTTLHWVFVKKAWRKLGIAKRLIPQDINTVSHLTKLGKALKPKDWKFNPFL